MRDLGLPSVSVIHVEPKQADVPDVQALTRITIFKGGNNMIFNKRTAEGDVDKHVRTKMKGAFCVVFILALLTGCSTQRFDVNAPIGPKGQPTMESGQAFFVGGLGQGQEVDAAEVCGGADLVASIETEETFLDGLLGVLSGGIYTPRTARVYCLEEIRPG